MSSCRIFGKDAFDELYLLNVLESNIQTLLVVQSKFLKLGWLPDYIRSWWIDEQKRPKSRDQNFHGQDPLECPWAAGCDVFFGQQIRTVSTMALLESSAYTSHAQLVAQLHRLCHLVFNLEA